MPDIADYEDRPPADPLSVLRHDLLTPLTTIHGRAQLMGRFIRRSQTLEDAERQQLLASLAAIDVAVRAIVARIDTLRPGDVSSRGDEDAGCRGED